MALIANSVLVTSSFQSIQVNNCHRQSIRVDVCKYLRSQCIGSLCGEKCYNCHNVKSYKFIPFVILHVVLPRDSNIAYL